MTTTRSAAGPLPFGPPPGPPVHTTLYRFWNEGGLLRQDQAGATYSPYPSMPGGDVIRVRFQDDREEVRFPRKWFANPENPVYPDRYVTVSPNPLPAMDALGIRQERRTGRNGRANRRFDPAERDTKGRNPMTLYCFKYDSDGNLVRTVMEGEEITALPETCYTAKSYDPDQPEIPLCIAASDLDRAGAIQRDNRGNRYILRPDGFSGIAVISKKDCPEDADRLILEATLDAARRLEDEAGRLRAVAGKAETRRNAAANMVIPGWDECAHTSGNGGETPC